MIILKTVCKHGVLSERNPGGTLGQRDRGLPADLRALLAMDSGHLPPVDLVGVILVPVLWRLPHFQPLDRHGGSLLVSLAKT